MIVEKTLELVNQRWIPLAQRGQPASSFGRAHFESRVQVRAQRQPLIGSECRHRFLKPADPPECFGGGRSALSPTFSASCVPIASVGPRFPRTKIHKRTSDQPALRGPARLLLARPG